MDKPTTATGLDLLDHGGWTHDPDDAKLRAAIIAIEQEARADLLKERDELRAALRELSPFADEIEAEYDRPSSRPQDAFDYRAVKGFIGWLADYRELLSKPEEQERG